MAELKASQVEQFLAKPDLSKSVFLIYGPDAGLVSERADQLAEKSGVDLSDPFCTLRIDADVLAAETTRLAEEAHTVGMFGGKRLIRISGTTRRDLVRAVQPVLDTPPADAMIIIEAGDLKKPAALRKQIEKHALSLAIPCYQDNDAAINQLIDQEITQAGLLLDNETRLLLRSLLGADRLISRSELTKLALYCSDRKAITLEDVRAVVGDASKLVLDDVVDATASGDPAKLETSLPKAIEAGNSPDMIVHAALRHFQMLQSARSKLERDRQSTSTIMATLRPPVHFSRKNKVGTAISTWPTGRIAKALARLDKAMLECRANAAISSSLAGTALLALALEARGLQKRR